MKNYAHDVRPPENNNPYDEWELKVLLAVNGQGVTRARVAEFLRRSETSVAKKSGQMGVSLKPKKK